MEDECRKKYQKHHWVCRLAFVILAGMSILLCGGWGKKEKQEQDMGRYAEQEIRINDKVTYESMFPLEDGGYALYASGSPVKLFYADGTEKKINDLWRNNTRIHVEYGCAVSQEGNVVLEYSPILSQKQLAELDSDIIPSAWLYLNTKGDKRVMETSGEGYTVTDIMAPMAFAPDHRLYMSDENGRVFRMDVETGRLQFLFESGQSVKEFGFVDDILIALTSEKALLYDMAEDELQEENELLNEFVQSHQIGKGGSGKSIVLSTGGEDYHILYLGCRTGLYQYVWDGTVIEQIADGALLSFSNSSYRLDSMQALDDGRFRVFFEGNHLYELYYDETLPSRPDKTLRIYSLEADGRIRYAAQLFQKKHPDVLVDYETGMDGDYAVTKEDALKKLNTELLAGEGPDLLVLDGFDIDRYIEKGVLKNLDEMIRPYLEDGVLYENIINSMQWKDGSIYAVPLSVWLPFWISDQKYMDGENSLEGLVAGMEQARAEHPVGALFLTRNAEELVSLLVCSSLPVWKQEDGSLNTEKITEFFAGVKRLWELQEQGLREEDQEVIEQTLGEDYYKTCKGMEPAFACSFATMGDEQAWAVFGKMNEQYDNLISIHCLAFHLEEEICYVGEPKDAEFGWGSCKGQAQNVFQGQTIVGICQNAEEPELAQEFYEMLLSEEMMGKWWLEYGIPISRATVERTLDINDDSYDEYWPGMKELYQRETLWPDEEEKQCFRDMMESAATFYQPESTLETAVTEVGVHVCSGELSPEEGTQEVSRKMMIEMEE